MTTDAADRAIADAREICAVLAPPFGEQPRGDLVARMLTDAGAAVERDAVGNVIGRLGSQDDRAPVIFAAHLDTVFAAGTEVVFTERDGRLAAPGIGDNSLGVAGLVHLAREFSGRPLERGVLLAATVGEEGLGDLRGAKALVAENPCGGFVAIEGQMLESIKIAIQVSGTRFVAIAIRHERISRSPPGRKLPSTGISRIRCGFAHPSRRRYGV